MHTKYHEASKEARLTNQNAKLAEEELEKLRLAQSQAQDATARQQQARTHLQTRRKCSAELCEVFTLCKWYKHV